MAGIKLKVHPQFPSNVYATSPLTLTKIDGNFTFGLDLNALMASILPTIAGTYLPLAGGTMTGPLILKGPPTVPLEAATKAYVDGLAGGAPGGTSGQVQYNNAGAFGGVTGATRDGSGNLLVTTQAARDNSTKSASTAYVDSATREKLTANRTYFVRSDGNNSNTGLVNSAGGAFLTAQRAIDVAATLDLNGFNITIQMVNNASTPQTYTGTVLAAIPFLGGNVALQGDNATPANLVISTGGANCITATNQGVKLDVSGFKFTTSSGGAAALVVADGALVRLVNHVEFAALSGACMQAQGGGKIIDFSNASGSTPHMKVTGNIGSFITTVNFGQVLHNNISCDIAAGLTCVNFVVSQSMSYIEHSGNTYTTSTFTGAKGVVQSNSVQNLAGAGTGTLPASGAHTPSTGGIVV